MRYLTVLLPIVLLVAAASCESESDFAVVLPPEVPAEAVPLATAFDPARCGTISGRVTWPGEKPVAPPFLFGSPGTEGNFAIQMIPNPNCPTIDEPSRGVVGAVVFLRGVKAVNAKPWDLKPVRVVLQDRGIQIHQGDAKPARSGFVRRGDAVAMLSVESVYHVLRARGSAYFSLPFPEPNQPLTRTFEKPGRVELSSAAGYYWASADLFVVDHPYYTLADSEGRFSFEGVPAGPVEVVAWLPGWDVKKQERDPETGLIFRQSYGSPREAIRKLTLVPQAKSEAILAFP